MIAAVDVADMLVRRGVPFRQSHGIVAGLVREAVDSGPHAVRSSRPRSWRATPRRSTTSSTTCSPSASWLESQGLRGRHRARPRARAARARARGARRPARLTLVARRSTTARWSRSRRALLGCVVRHGDTAGVIVETEAYHESEPACHAYVGLTRAHAARCSGRPGRAYVYRSYGIHALLNAVCEPRGRRRRGADPRARAARGDRPHARAPRARARRGPVLGPGQAHAGARHRRSSTTATDLAAGPIAIEAPPPGWEQRRAGRRARGSGSPRRPSCRGGSASRARAACRGPGRRAARA